MEGFGGEAQGVNRGDAAASWAENWSGASTCLADEKSVRRWQAGVEAMANGAHRVGHRTHQTVLHVSSQRPDDCHITQSGRLACLLLGASLRAGMLVFVRPEADQWICPPGLIGERLARRA